MQKAAHVIALVIAYLIWQAIGGIGGLIVAALAVGLVEIVVMAVLGAASAPFKSDFDEGSQEAEGGGPQSEADHVSRLDRLKPIAAELRRLAARAFENPGPLLDEERERTVSRLLATFARHVDAAADALRSGDDMHGRAVSPAQVGGLLAGVCGECRRLVERVAEVCGSEVTHCFRDLLDEVSNLADEMTRSRNGDIDKHTPAHAAGCAEAPQVSPMPHNIDDLGTSGKASPSPSVEWVSCDRGAADAPEAPTEACIHNGRDQSASSYVSSIAKAAVQAHPAEHDQQMSGRQAASETRSRIYAGIALLSLAGLAVLGSLYARARMRHASTCAAMVPRQFGSLEAWIEDARNSYLQDSLRKKADRFLILHVVLMGGGIVAGVAGVALIFPEFCFTEQ